MALDMTTLFLQRFGILELLERYNVETKGKTYRSYWTKSYRWPILSILMGRKGFPGNSTNINTQLHQKYRSNHNTSRYYYHCFRSSKLLESRKCKDGAVIIDVGITRVPDETREKDTV
jgi:methylenetetrahydrofolate dehydrogenase (NADP+)/methenyltetrahydrofolate cyclohydrolase